MSKKLRLNFFDRVKVFTLIISKIRNFPRYTLWSVYVETATVCDQILNDEKNLNGKFLEFLDKESERTQKPFRKLVESLYKKFQKERRDNLSSWSLEMLRLREERKKNGNTTIPDLNIIDVDSSLTDYSLTM